MSAFDRDHLTRRALLSGGIAAFGTALAAQAPLSSVRPMARPERGEPVPADGGPPRPDERLRARTTLDELITQAGLGGMTAVVIADAATGRVLEQRSGPAPMWPASTTKSMTALYALDALGPEHRFGTRLLGTGTLTDGVLSGDLWLVGGSDPGLDSDGLATLAERLVAAGVREVRGAFRVWGGLEIAAIDPSQLPYLSYNPAVSELNLNYNRVHFSWRRQGGNYTVGMDARTDTQQPVVTMATMRVAEQTALYGYADASGVEAWSVRRGALGEAGTRWLPVRQPAFYAGDVFRTLALGRGLVLGAPVVRAPGPQARELVRFDSPPLDEIIRDMLLYSNNLTAEVIGRAASAARGEGPATLAQSAAQMNRWLAGTYGVNPDFVDHSGLSDASRISAGDMAKVLVGAQATGQLRPLLKTITLVDENREPLASPPGRVVAKTGTLNFVSTLAGYLRTTGGADLVFAILSAEPERRAAVTDSTDEAPAGTWEWNADAKRLQQRLLQRWARVFAG